MCSGKALPEGPKAFLPELIIRERRGADKSPTYTFFFMRDMVEFNVTDIHYSTFECFNPNKVIWLIEPGDSDKSCCPIIHNNINYIATVPPYMALYKEARKDVADLAYMLPYTLKELIVIGKHIKSKLPPHHPCLPLLTDELIKQRYERFGGIFCRVIPVDNNRLSIWEEQLKNAVSQSSNGKELYQRAVECLYAYSLSSESSYIVQWSPLVELKEDAADEEDNRMDLDIENVKQIEFFRETAMFASQYVVSELRAALQLMDINEMRGVLSRCRTMSSYADFGESDDAMRMMFEEFVILSFLQESAVVDHTGSIPVGSLRTCKRCFVHFDVMEEGVLYYPSRTTFPGVEAYFVMKGVLYVIQTSVTATDKICSNGALAAFLKKIHFPMNLIDDNKLVVIYARFYDKSNWLIQIKHYKM